MPQLIGFIFVIWVIGSIGSCIDDLWESDSEKSERLEQEAQLAYESRQAAAAKAAQGRIRQDMEVFAFENLAPAVDAKRQMQTMLSQMHTSISELRQQLTALGRNPEKDEDFVSWQKRSEELRQSIKNLDVQMEDAYLAYQKYLLDPEKTGGEEEFKRLVRVAEASASEAVARYAAMAESPAAPFDPDQMPRKKSSEDTSKGNSSRSMQKQPSAASGSRQNGDGTVGIVSIASVETPRADRVRAGELQAETSVDDMSGNSDNTLRALGTSAEESSRSEHINVNFEGATSISSVGALIFAEGSDEDRFGNWAQVSGQCSGLLDFILRSVPPERRIQIESWSEYEQLGEVFFAMADGFFRLSGETDLAARRQANGLRLQWAEVYAEYLVNADTRDFKSQDRESFALGEVKHCLQLMKELAELAEANAA